MTRKAIKNPEGLKELEEFTRRHFFLNLVSGLLVAISGAAILYSVFRFLSPSQDGAAGSFVEIDESEITPGEAYFFKFKNKPAVILQQDGEYHVLSAVCTHLGCIVKWKDDVKVLECPCHAGQYGLDGKVIAGPPPEPLPLIQHSSADGKLLIGETNA